MGLSTEVLSYANVVGHQFSYQMGVNRRHLFESTQRKHLPQSFVHRELEAVQRTPPQLRELTSSASSSVSSTSGTLNWCSTDNSYGYNICSDVKSQENCGSCWAFAATDAIETAVVIAANQTSAVALSPEQFIRCSTRTTEQTFTYCWASGGISGSSWVSESIKWKSTNDGCSGGMTHGAFMDAAQLSYGLVTELEMPYDDSDGSSSSSSSNTSCPTSTDNTTAATISGWEQVVGSDCSVSSDANVLLKTALKSQPIAVAINSEDPFQDYSSGFYTCPNSGDLSTKDDVNHALLLVGYGTDSTYGDYWILKNSYGSSWGISGYMKLIADSKLNCGLNIFPVIPTGAAAGAASAAVDGGGDEVFVGLSVTAWIALAVVVSVLTILATIGGLIVAKKRRAALRNQSSGVMYINQTPNHPAQQQFNHQ